MKEYSTFPQTFRTVASQADTSTAISRTVEPGFTPLQRCSAYCTASDDWTEGCNRKCRGETSKSTEKRIYEHKVMKIINNKNGIVKNNFETNDNLKFKDS